ncbi:MAG: hypothetical protein LBQ48_02795 [Oscillospiraceae bacterium]|jgi:hypothetical protein|nr:hypothetical protein [Oscillospiraceae bacterium]
MGINMIESPSLHEIKDELPDDVWEHIDSLYNSGRSVIPYLKKVIANDNPECSALFRKYLTELDAFNNSAGYTITTHRRLLTLDVGKYDLVIVDEDIIFSTIIPNKTDISIHDLKKLLKKIVAGSPPAAKIRKILKCIKTAEFFTLKKISYDKACDDISTAIDISSFCSATHFCFRKASDRESGLTEDCVSFTNPVTWANNTKYIMVSATVDETTCKYYFKDNMKFYDCKKARHEGTLNQYYDRSMSRADIYKDPAVIDRIKDWSGFEATITFKKYQRGNLYFGNSAGCDNLKGKNLDVIGTPHQPEWIYKLFAYSLGLDFDLKERLKPGTMVEHNGWRFRFTAFDNEELRAIQFYMIESELEQAVGRARLLRCNCTVNLFSNFPLRQADLRKSEYDKESTQ